MILVDAPRQREKRIGVCNLCEAICGLELTIEGREVTGVRGNTADPCRAGTSAPRGSRSPTCTPTPTGCVDPCAASARARTPRWEEIGWDEAFDLVADHLARVINEHGDDALGVYLGNPNAHSLGSMTHGTAMFKSFRTRNRYSATSVDQLPHQLVAHLDVRPPALPADPRHRPHLVVPGRRRQPDGLQRLADDGARLPAAGARPARARRPDGRPRPAAHRDREGGRRAPLRPPGHRRVGAARDAARPHHRGPAARAHRAVVRRRARHGGRPGRRLHPRARRGDERAAGRRRSAGSRASCSPPTPASSTAASGSPQARGARCASGRSPASTSSPATSTGPAGPCSPRRRSTPWAPVSSGAGTTTHGARGCAGSRRPRASCRWRRCARRSRRPARARCARC